ncbi:MAG: transposase [Candidatus Thorarchaeota archaeon]
MCLKVYNGTSSRRIISDLELCKRIGYIEKIPHFNTLLHYFKNGLITKDLKYLIRLSSLPLAQLERKFAIDSTGIAERKYLPRWSHVRGKTYHTRSYKKIHAIVGTLSNVVVSVWISQGNKHDSPYFKKLLEDAAKRFQIEEISADLAYSSIENINKAHELNVNPYIPFKSNVTGKRRGSVHWQNAFFFFKNNPEEFYKHYHIRSNVESAFFMIKQRFRDFAYTKNYTSQINEILCKILCHNIIVLIQEIFLSNLDIDFKECRKRIAQ